MAAPQRRRSTEAPARAPQPVAALDIGCSKITCLIARPHPSKPRHFKLIGSGRQPSRGFSAGTVTDMDALERAIRLAVEAAEREAGEAIRNVVLGITGRQLQSRLLTTALPIGGRVVTARDMRRLQTQTIHQALDPEMELIAAWPVSWRIDSNHRVRAPDGMHARELGLVLSLVQAPQSHVKNLVECLGRAHLGVSALVPSAVASATGTLIDDELVHGATCIDMGAGVTALSVYLHGMPAWLGLVPAGGGHVTSDIAQGLGTTFAAAERIKIQHGLAEAAQTGLPERIDIGRLGDDGRLMPASLDRATLAAIIRPRIEEIFELADQRLRKSAVRNVLPRRIVLTGGASELPGVKEIAQRILQAPVRLSKPSLAEFLGESLATPAFATASGLLLYQGMELSVLPDAGGRQSGEAGEGGLAGSVLGWLRENF